MIHLPASVRVYLCLAACDMRKSFDGLHALVRDHLELDPFAGHLVVFASRRRDRVKMLYWDRDGVAVWKQAAGRGHICRTIRRQPRRAAARDHRVGVSRVAERIDLSQAQRRKR
jgi:transposase